VDSMLLFWCANHQLVWILGEHCHRCRATPRVWSSKLRLESSVGHMITSPKTGWIVPAHALWGLAFFPLDG
jgi:hypothetical protein